MTNIFDSKLDFLTINSNHIIFLSFLPIHVQFLYLNKQSTSYHKKHQTTTTEKSEPLHIHLI